MRSSLIDAALFGILFSFALAEAGAQTEPTTDEVDVYEASVSQLATELAAGRTTSVQLVDSYLARIAAYDDTGPALNAILRLNPEARSHAEGLDQERRDRGPRGPLHGVPVLVKDNYEVAGLVTSNGSIAFAEWIPGADAFVVRRLKEAGAVILGMTNMHEMAAGITTISSVGGQTRNPYDPSRNPGGSSGGTAAAIAANFAAMGWGSDTCGSIRIPASYQSLFGLRPTTGLFNTEGIFPLSRTQDVPGPLARTVTDLAIGLDATLPERSPLPDGAFRSALNSADLSGLRIGVVSSYFGDTAEEQEVTSVLRMAIDTMRAHGADVLEVTIQDLDGLTARSGLILQEFKWDLIKFLAERPTAPVRGLSEIIDRGLYHLALENTYAIMDTVSPGETEHYRLARGAQEELRRAVLKAFDDQALDVLTYPTVRRKPAVLGEEQYGQTCELSAQTGYPAVTMPAGFTPDGLPVGLELLGRPLSDDRLVAIAYAFEAATRIRQPPYSTPPLVGGRAPEPVAIQVDFEGLNGQGVTGRFSFDITDGTLDYTLRVKGERPTDIRAVTLNLISEDEKGPVAHVLLRDGSTSGAGTIMLSHVDRQALQDGSFAIVLYSRDHASGLIGSRLTLP
jgi:amidase